MGFGKNLFNFWLCSALTVTLCALVLNQRAVLQQANPAMTFSSVGLIPLDDHYESLVGASSCQGLVDCATVLCSMFYRPNVTYAAVWPVGSPYACATSNRQAISQQSTASGLFLAQEVASSVAWFGTALGLALQACLPKGRICLKRSWAIFFSLLISATCLSVEFLLITTAGFSVELIDKTPSTILASIATVIYSCQVVLLVCSIRERVQNVNQTLYVNVF